MKKKSGKKYQETKVIAYLVLLLLLISSIGYFAAAYFLRLKPMMKGMELSQLINFMPTTNEEPFLGNENASITIVAYSGFLCEACRKFHDATFAYLKENYIGTGKAKYYHKTFLTQEDISERGVEFDLARLLTCMKGENPHGFFESYDLWFRMTQEDLESLLGKQPGNFMECYDAAGARLRQDMEKNTLFGILLQPMMYIGIDGHDNIILSGNPPDEAIRKALRQKEIALGMP